MTGAHLPETEALFEHPALFYSGLDAYLEGTIPYIDAGLDAGEPVAVAVPTLNLASVRDALGTCAEQVLLIDMAEAGANPGRIIPGVVHAFAEAHLEHRVRLITESTWPGRTGTEYPACAQHEALVNLAFTDHAATILCPYDTAGLDRHMIADARATHPVLIDRTGCHPSDQYDPDRVFADHNQQLPTPPWTAIERAADQATLDNARWFLTSYGRKAGLSDTKLIDLEIAVTELLTNSIEHGGGIGTLRIWTDDRHLICDVSDAGHLTDPLAGRRPAHGGERHGRGLLLANHIVDLVRTHTCDTGTTVRIHLRLPTSPHQSSPGGWPAT
ncbi:sensor histidine kinase [Glycomyces sp. TRM65418]|uniref:sensor histidine kinase n=1 Tax=Glycomyces sp. TRM65418 TaxID=2867006 RepID=UPI001CE5351E|nr:sensor histidine kinase [Glycomyces sp. TRM65418]MCC3764068.1 sensor histidine kinase [Glycomyces sp. TRM65418]QZD53758.1 sensor histidine kinase [Glycomyces sp. TRM65418]